ncbi:POLE2 [Lepeophtheirus salmonis]|uniref:DNA polymerase epsilon subunit n=1 Tax=Lepeophtheirus salmonis TaxID=72036 RepID=A0A7R8CM17_LEPSM|nr:POLE2 [Lepeophtheirus salmonis]CAF2858966.1 POLE2 [Lepeophtheirus salmonis]
MKSFRWLVLFRRFWKAVSLFIPLIVMATPLGNEIVKSFKLRGYSLKLDARKHFESLLSALEDRSEVKEWMGKVLDTIEKRLELLSPLIGKEDLLRAIQDCSREESGEDDHHVLSIISAFQVPKFTYSYERKKYIPSANPSSLLYSGADAKADFFNSRYDLLCQRTSRHDLFTPAVAGVRRKIKKFHLKKIDYLLGTSDKLSDVIILGMISQMKSNRYSLEDPTGVVTMDLSETKFQSGLYAEGCFVLVEGWYEDYTFHVIAMGFPPTEKSETTRAYFGDINFFGGPMKSCVKSNKRLAQMEKDRTDSMFVFLSDVWLDKPAVQTKLHQLFTGYSSMPPICFVFMGNFLSAPYATSEVPNVLKEHFRVLGETIAEYPDLVENSRFVFVPGPTDPGLPNIFPRPPIPKYIAGDLLKKSTWSCIGYNPCRIQYCTQEIVLFREDIVTKMCRNCIYFPESGDIPTHFSKTIISQSHLAPLALHICPIYWEHDAAMSLLSLRLKQYEFLN